MLWSNISAQSGQWNIFVDTNGGSLNELQIVNLQIDNASTGAFVATGATGSGNGLSITNVRGSTNGGVLFSIGKLYSEVSISDVTASKVGSVSGVLLDGPSGVSLSNISINGSNNAGGGDACVNINANSGQPTTNVSLDHVFCGRSYAPTVGLSISAHAHVGLKISDCQFQNAVTPIVDSNTNPTIYTGWVGGMSDAIPTASSGSTLTFPHMAQGGLATVTGTTGVGAVAGLYEGQYGSFLTTDGAVTLTAGGTIGNTVTTTQNVPVGFSFHNSKIWLR